MTTDYPRCRTCRWWGGQYNIAAQIDPDGASGECLHPDGREKMKIRLDPDRYEPRLEEGDVVTVTGDFGCVHHEPAQGDDQ